MTIRPNRKLKFIAKLGDFELFQGLTRGSEIKSEQQAATIKGGHIPAFFIKQKQKQKKQTFRNLERYINKKESRYAIQ